MASTTTAAAASDEDAFDWAQSHTAIVDTELERNSPWARTCRLSDGRIASYLKILPDHLARILRPAAILAKKFPRHVPEVIASNVECGWMLSADHEGQPLNYDDSEPLPDSRTVT